MSWTFWVIDVLSLIIYWYGPDTVVTLTEGETEALDAPIDADSARAVFALADLARPMMDWRLLDPRTGEETYRRAGRWGRNEATDRVNSIRSDWKKGVTHGKAFTHRIPRIEGHQIVSRKQKIGSRRIDYRMRNSDCELLNLETGEFMD